ncbi:cryptochrome DASH, chloroplastic/mitochondrial isoform X2 [Primulina huaijiensis]|uniref:cryptochrome DASH, chloroplastic/mitochondrial isoform X2 n=1 Tax=Primulina huaijiensis TaxID=1492673 RepID=UPI003CC7125D
MNPRLLQNHSKPDEMIHHLTIIFSRPSANLFLHSTKPSFQAKSPERFVVFCCLSRTMHSSNAVRTAQTVHQVPDFGPDEIERVADQAFQRYSFDRSSALPKRKGKGVAIVWFRNDLRILDNEVLFKAWASSEVVLPVYCVDPRHLGTTHYFGFPKTGALRAQFLIQCLADLKRNLLKRGLNLFIQLGKPEDVLPALAKTYEVHTVYAQKETCSEELTVERLVSKNLQSVLNPTSTTLELIWGCSMYHIDDLPFSCESLPDIYTQFRKSVESKSSIRNCIKFPTSLGPAPNVDDWGSVPELSSLGLQTEKVSKGMSFAGGESAALSRVQEYFWKKDLLRTYKITRNGMLGPDYSTKFSIWLASGCLSPRFIYEEVKRYEKTRESNDSTYWVLFELIWRDYFRFLSIKQGNSLFHAGGPRKIQANWSQDQALFDLWKNGCTGYPLIDANMKELLSTGFMSNRGRQIVCSFLVRDMGIDWRMGAEWFETCLLDYDPCSNYGNWTYGAGVGNDPREDRYFSIPKQAQNYDPEGEFVAFWLPQLRALPKEKRNFPGMSYIKPIVALKFGNTKTINNRETTSGTRREESKWKGDRGNRM